MTVFAHPAGLAGRIADPERVGWYVFGDDGPCSYEGISTDVVPANDGGIGTDGGALANVGGGVFATTVDGTAWVDDVGENN